jgi:TPR repeat protein
MTTSIQIHSINDLLAAPVSEASAEALWAWVAQLQERILRGDLAAGLLPLEEVQQVPVALAKVASVMPEAWLDLAFWHMSPPYGEPSVAAAEQALQAAMAADVPTAVLNWVQLAWDHQRDTLPEAARRERFERLRQLLQAEPQQAEALNLAGYLTTNGFGTPADPAAGLALHEQAAERLNTDALFEIAIHHFNGLGVPVDNAAGLRAMQRAAAAGQVRAMYNMGAFHAVGRFTDKDPQLAAHWYARAAEAGHAQACVNLASLYALGDGLPVDLAKAAAWLDEAQAQGVQVDELRAQLLR